MSERRVIVSLTREQAQAVLGLIDEILGDDPTGLHPVGIACQDGGKELRSALAIYDLTQSTVSRLAAVPHLDAASLTEHDASSTETYR